MFDPASRKAITATAKSIKVPPAALLAVAEVESSGQPLADVNGGKEPLIRWEGHYFHRLLSEPQRTQAVKKGLASPAQGGVKNPGTQQARYNLLDRAKAIDEAAALASCSWGLGQVMGANWRDLGYASVQALVAEARSGVAGQVKVMAKFIVKNDLVDELQRLDFTAFARRYNGPNYGDYDVKMRRACQRYAAEGPEGVAPAAAAADEGDALDLRIGAKGPAVSELQEKLRKLGYYLHVDGDFGTATLKIVRDFQRDAGLSADGVVGKNTWTAIETRLR